MDGAIFRKPARESSCTVMIFTKSSTLKPAAKARYSSGRQHVVGPEA